MSNIYKNVAPQLIKKGFRIVPILPNDKRPNAENWVNNTFTGLEPQYAEYGCGIKCGQGDYPVAAIDLDIYDKDIFKELYKYVISKISGLSLERVGLPPKKIIVVRTETPLRKKQTKAYKLDGKSNKVEILGAGNQFVAYGIHPATKKPYKWLDIFGGPLELDVRQLAIVSETVLNDIISKSAEILDRHLGKPVVYDVAGTVPPQIPESPTADYIPLTIGDVTRKGYSADDVRKMLVFPADTHDPWIHVGMALHHEFNGSDEGFQLFDDWSREFAGGNYEGSDYIRSRYVSMGKHTDINPITISHIEYRYREFTRESSAQAVELFSAPLPQNYDEKALKDLRNLIKLQREVMLSGGQISTGKQQIAVIGITGKLLRKHESKDVIEWRIAEESVCAKTLAEHLQGFFAYCKISQQWFEFVGTNWEKVNPQIFTNIVTLFVDEGIKRDRLEKGYKSNFIAGVCKLLRSSPKLELPVLPEKAIPFINGVYQYDEGIDVLGEPYGKWVFKPLSRRNSLTWYIPYPYIPKPSTGEPDTPIFNGILANLFPRNARRFVLCLVRQAVSPLSGIHKIFVFSGAGGAGKSTFISIFISLAGKQNCYITQFETIEAKNNRFELANIPGKKIIAIPDMGDYRGSFATTKQISGEDLFRCEEKGVQGTYNASWKGLFIAGSNKPLASRNTDSGLMRRIVNVKVNHNLNNSKVREFLLDDKLTQLEKEFPSILREALEIPDEEVLITLHGDIHKTLGYDESEKAESAFNVNPLYEFVINYIQPKEGVLVPIGKLKRLSYDRDSFENAGCHVYPAYAQWYYSQGFTGHAKDIHEFLMQLETSILSIAQSNQDYQDVKLINRSGIRYLKNACIYGQDLETLQVLD